jgi:hypothetical protein
MDGAVRVGRRRPRRAVAAGVSFLVLVVAAAFGPASPAAAARDVVPFGPDSAYKWDNGVAASIVSATPFRPDPAADGLVAGQTAVRIVVKITNGSDGRLDVGATTVNVKAGPDGVQATSIFDATHGIGVGLSGVIAPGHSATAPYGFSIPAADLDQVDVEVVPDYNYDSAIFEGAVR